MIRKIAETLISWGVTDNVMTLACAILGAVEEAIPAEEECGRFENAHLQSKADGRNEVISEIRKNLGLDK